MIHLKRYWWLKRRGFALIGWCWRAAGLGGRGQWEAGSDKPTEVVRNSNYEAVTLFVLSEIQLISDGRSGNGPNSVTKKIRNKKYYVLKTQSE